MADLRNLKKELAELKEQMAAQRSTAPPALPDDIDTWPASKQLSHCVQHAIPSTHLPPMAAKLAFSDYDAPISIQDVFVDHLAKVHQAVEAGTLGASAYSHALTKRMTRADNEAYTMTAAAGYLHGRTGWTEQQRTRLFCWALRVSGQLTSITPEAEPTPEPPPARVQKIEPQQTVRRIVRYGPDGMPEYGDPARLI